jgi:uncharacterized protein YbcI
MAHRRRDQDSDHGTARVAAPARLVRVEEQTSSRPSDDQAGSVRTALANAVMGIMKQYYGKGPVGAKAWLLDDFVFIAMEGGLTRNEETLLEDGKEEMVRAYRLAFQETMSDTMMGAVAELTGRRVLTYHSQIVFRPTRAFEIFVLEPRAS